MPTTNKLDPIPPNFYQYAISDNSLKSFTGAFLQAIDINGLTLLKSLGTWFCAGSSPASGTVLKLFYDYLCLYLYIDQR